MTLGPQFEEHAEVYRKERDAHGRTLAGDGCRCGHKASGVGLHRHITTAVTKASRAYEAATRRVR